MDQVKRSVLTLPAALIPLIKPKKVRDQQNNRHSARCHWTEPSSSIPLDNPNTSWLKHIA